MSMIEIDWSPSPRELRKFGVTTLIGFLLIGAVAYYFDKTTVAYVCWGLGAVLGGAALTGTVAGLWAYRAWMGVAFVMGNIISRFLMALIFYGLFWPMGAIRRALGADPLQLNKRATSSYWTPVGPPTDKQRAERQF
ncbi:MAG: hypothetical protein SFX18_16035 [Pirellulales bacterium]|nr:hypothetical protein [Pirellulales bacterium]